MENVIKNNFYTKNTFMGLLTSKFNCAGKIEIALPPVSGNGAGNLISGFLADELTLEMGNTWGSIIPSGESLRQVAQTIGMNDVFTWIQASAVAWKGTQPLTFTIDVYLVTLFRNQSPSILSCAKEIMKMSALYTDNDDIATAKIHGGYSVDYATANYYIGSGGSIATLLADSKKTQQFDPDKANKAFSGFQKDVASPMLTGTQQGTITLYINDTMKIENLLLERTTITHSKAYVDEITPLYVKLGLSFRTFRSPTVKDIENLYKSV